MMADKYRCSETCHDANASFGERYRQCKRAGVVERDGKLYCRQHDPDAIEAKQEERRQRAREHNRLRRIERAAPALLAACEDARHWLEDETLNDLDELSDDAKRVLQTLRAAIAKARGEEPTS